MRLDRPVRWPRGIGNAKPGSGDEWSSGKETHHGIIIVITAVLAGIILVSTIVLAFPSYIDQYFGPAPVWHAFSGVFDNSGQLASESCSLQNLQPVLSGIGGIKSVTPASIAVCSYHGESYTGYMGKDCNLNPTGPIPSINGTLIPYGGCVLSYAPLNRIFTSLYFLKNKAANDSIAVHSNQKLIENMTPAGNWKPDGCTFETSNVTRSNGPLKCSYLGIAYSTTDVLQNCNFGTPIQVNGVPIPADSCNLLRAETVTG